MIGDCCCKLRQNFSLERFINWYHNGNDQLGDISWSLSKFWFTLIWIGLSISCMWSLALTNFPLTQFKCCLLPATPGWPFIEVDVSSPPASFLKWFLEWISSQRVVKVVVNILEGTLTMSLELLYVITGWECAKHVGRFTRMSEITTSTYKLFVS